MNTTNRTVHADHPSGEQVVRYDRPGKWFIEHAAEPQPGRSVTMYDAASRATELAAAGGQVHLGQLGGAAFDAAVRRLAGMPV